MCTEPLYAIRLKTEYDVKFKRFGIRTPIKVLCAVRDVGKDTSKLYVDKEHYDLIMVSCGQCMRCRLDRVRQKAVMSICESLDHDDNCFVTLTFGYPQTYCYYRHEKGLSHYLSKKKAHFHEWSLETETFTKFMKRLRNWFYNYQLCLHLKSLGRSDLIPSLFPYVTHVRLPLLERPFLLKDFKPQKIRVMHCGEYGSSKNRPHHHCILFGFKFPDLKPIYIDTQLYYTSEILKKLWPFGFHTIGKCEYNSCAYVARYVTKKINGDKKFEHYDGRKSEYVTYSTKPVLGSNYFKKNYKEFVNTGLISVYKDKKYECTVPKSYEKILKDLDYDLYLQFKEKRVENCVKDLDKLLSSPRSIYSHLDSSEKNTLAYMKQEIRSYENQPDIFVDDLLKKAKAFGLTAKHLSSQFKDNYIKFLSNKDYSNHKSKSSNSDLHEKYYEFELARKRAISHCYNVNVSDELVYLTIDALIKKDNPYKCEVRGRSLPDTESIDNDNIYVDEKGKEIIYGQ